MFSIPSIASTDTLGMPRWLMRRLLTLVTTLTGRRHLDKISAIGVKVDG
ncbi:hypothetical protein J2853_007360 [Streptosporangium lutulentum]|uniref:Uncharacterized protein n=1 Tax=Streptosporangium lutulentum TaxID=1461250 RepID=A0ABT9QQ85_9ACTN|nr:hypothetical protein [Streptosporangium lutulentum]